MRKIRVMYLASIAFTILLLFMTDSWYLSALIFVQILFPLLLSLLLWWDVKTLEIRVEVRQVCRMGAGAPVCLHVSHRHFPTALGTIGVTVEWNNRMLGESRAERMWFSPGEKEQEIPVRIDFSCCGEIQFTSIRVQAYDIMGLCSKKLCAVKNQWSLVYPKAIDLRIDYSQPESGRMEGQWKSISRRGKDISEIYDLREYQPGDSMRSIHWKLSGKTDSYIVKETGETLHADTVLLLDVGKYSETGEIVDKKLIDMAVAFGQKCSRRLMETGVRFVAMYASGELLHERMVLEQPDWMSFVEDWMSVCMPEKAGTALQLWNRDCTEDSISRMIYVTAGRYPDLISHRMGDFHITAVCITPDGDGIGSTEHENIQMFTIPGAMTQSGSPLIL